MMVFAGRSIVRKSAWILLSLCLFVGLAGPAAAAKKATLLGELVDADGTPLPGVNVTVRGPEFEETVTTDKGGRFKVRVPDAAAEYEILFDREGFPTYSEPLTFDERGGSQGKAWTMTATPPDSTTDSMVALHAYNAGARAHNDGDFDLALQKFGEAVAEDPEFVEAHAQIARLLLLREDHEQSASAAARALALDPDHVGALQILYDAEHALGRDGAAATLDRLAELDPGPDTAVLAYNEGRAAHAGGDRERARSRYELAARLDPTLVPAHTALAGLLLELKQYDAALAGTARALELDPENVRAVSLRYNTLIAAGREEESTVVLEKLQVLAPEVVGRAFLERGTALFEAGEIDPAISALERSLDADPQLAPAHRILGLCYMNADRKEDARRHLEIFLELAGDDPDAESIRRLLEVLGPPE